MTLRRWMPQSAIMTATLLGLLSLAASAVHSSEAGGNTIDSVKAVEQKSVSLAPPLVQATVGLSIVGGPGMGSGVIVSEDGLILTAGHVVPAAGKEMRVHFADGKVVKAKALGADKVVDAGMAQITEEGKWPYIKVGNSADLKKGDWILAIGNPGGFFNDRKPPVRIGRVLSLPVNRSFPWLRTDATVAPGDSGGPLFNLNGEVVGIHSNISPDLTENRHVPTAEYIAHWNDLKDGKQTGRMFDEGTNRAKAQLGIQPEDNGEDVRIGEVVRNSPAEKAGIKKGDIVLRLDGREVINADDVRRKLARKLPNAEVKLELDRQGEKVEVTAKMQASPQNFDNPPAEFKAFLDKHAKKMPDGSYEFQATPDTEEEFKKLQEKFGSRRGRFMFIGMEPRIDRNDTKTSPKLLEALAGVTTPFAKSVAKIYQSEKDDKPITYGTVISKDGYILTKASELKDDFYCVVGDREFDAKVVARRDDFDLALLKVDAKDLTPVKWASQTDPSTGTLLVTPNPDGKPLALGIVSNDTRKILRNRTSANKAVLGISLDLTSEVAKIDDLSPGGPAAKAGLKAGDVILSVNGKQTPEKSDLIAILSTFKPGDKVKLEVKRGEKSLDLEARLGDPTLLDNNPPPSRLQQQNRRPGSEAFDRSAATSKRKDNFPEALTHDTMLKADQCGGPILNLAGQAVGVNIARFDRTGTYALTYKTLKPLLEQMIQDSKKPISTNPDN
jgi:serine protease Do